MKDIITVMLLVAAVISLAVTQFVTSSRSIVLNNVKETRAFTAFIQYHQDWDILAIKQDDKIFKIEYIDKNTKEMKIRSFRLHGIHLFPIDKEV